MYDDESDSDKPDENQIELVKKLHREMADRRIIVNMKNKIKNKKECVNLKPNKPKSVAIALQKSAQHIWNSAEIDQNDQKGQIRVRKSDLSGMRFFLSNDALTRYEIMRK